jgi:hypothetical protein
MGRFRSVYLVALAILAPMFLFAQFNNNTTSPYSRFGIGDLQPYSFGRTYAMGGASIASRDNRQINLANPASYTAVDSLGFMFEFGFAGKFTNYSNDITSMNSNDVNFRYFAMNFRITDWMATGLGLTPYSDVGYDVKINENIDNTGDVLHSYFGVGSLSKAFFGLAIEPVKNISVGANLNYLFGTLNRNSEIYFLSSTDFYNIQKYERIRLRDFGLSLGVQASLPLQNDRKIVIGATIENKPKYTAFFSDLTQKNISSENTSDLDTLNFQSKEKSVIQFPLTFGAGISYIKTNSLEINADFYHQSWSKATFFDAKYPNLTDLNKFAVGAEWIPDRFSIRSYLNRIAYRAGLKLEKSYLKFDNQQINDFGISFGVGLPVYRSNSTINVAAEVGRRGTKANNLVIENYAILNLSVNLYDLWFIKRKYD